MKTKLIGISICFQDLFQLNGAKTDLSSPFTTHLEPAKIPDPMSFHDTISDPRFNLSEVPTALASPPQDTSIPWSSFPGTLELGEVLQYHFEDSVVVTAREIFFHPYLEYVAARLLPLTSLTPEALQNVPWLHLPVADNLPSWGSLRKTELALIAVMIRASQESFELWISNSTDRSKKRSAFALKKIALMSKFHSHWEVGTQGDWTHDSEKGRVALSFKEVPQNAKSIILRGFELDFQERSLLFHPYDQLISQVNQNLHLLGQRNGDTDLPDDRDVEFNHRSYLLQWNFTGHRKIQHTLESIDRSLRTQGFPTLQRTYGNIEEDVQVEPQIWITQQGAFHFVRKVKSKSGPMHVWNFPPLAKSLADGLMGGLGATVSKEPKELAQVRKGIRRDRDLKILKHAGIFGLILLETTTFIFEQTNTEGRSLVGFPAFFTSLLDRLGVLLHDLEKKAGFYDFSPPVSLDKLCSKPVIDLIRDQTSAWIEFCSAHYDSVFTQTGEIRLPGDVRSLLLILHTLLARIAADSRTQCFYKPRLNAFQLILATLENSDRLVYASHSDDEIPTLKGLEDSYQVNESWLPPSLLLQTLLPLEKQGFHLFYNGLPVNEMESQDFRPEFDIQEVEAPPSSAKAIDWFELHPKFFFKGVEIEGEQLQKLSRDGVLEFQGKIYLIQNKNLPSLKRLESFWSKIQKSRPNQQRRKTEETYLRLPRHQTLELLALRASGLPVRGGKRWQKICDFYDSLDKVRDPLEVPSGIKAELKPYQKQGIQWLLDLYDLGLGGILADDMGLGKTVQTLSFLEILRTRKQMGHTLVIVPTSLTYNWMSESKRFTPQVSIEIFQSKRKEDLQAFLASNTQAIVVCTYGLFTEHLEFFSNHPWNILVFDEAQNLKNISAKRTTASRKISAHFKLCLTGTPLENHLGEFYSLMDLVVSGSLGELSDFREKFVTPETIASHDLQFLKQKTRPLILRRNKKNILTELPPKLESIVKLPFEQKQERIYRDIALSWNEKVKESILSQGESKSQLMMLTALLRLRQACSDPASIPHVRYTETPPKLSVLLDALHEITESGESALVFTQFLHTFERIQKELKSQNITSFSLHGGTSRAAREKTLQEFQNSQKGSVLLMTLKTGGVGLNLVKASYVFHLEPWWNPAVENQATDRAHRIGQEKPVQVYRYLMKESVEEKIEILKDRKSAKFNSLFSSAEDTNEVSSGGVFLNQRDFEYLLS